MTSVIRGFQGCNYPEKMVSCYKICEVIPEFLAGICHKQKDVKIDEKNEPGCI